jgi:hypothetical protein
MQFLFLFNLIFFIKRFSALIIKIFPHNEFSKFNINLLSRGMNEPYFDDSGNPEVEEALEFWRKNMLQHFGVEE